MGGLVGRSADAAQPQPNVVVIVADDLGYADVGVYGSTEIPTPNIDALAASGIRFTNGYSSGPICSPSRAGFITGRYQARFGFDANAEERAAPTGQASRALDLKEVTIAQRLKAAGYATGAFGKWHLGATDGYFPTQRGFDEFYGLLPYGIASHGPGGPPYYRGTTEVPKPTDHIEQFATEALSFIDRKAGKPFFLYLPLTAVHGPFVAPEKWTPPLDSDVPANRRKYAADLVQLDDVVGRVTKRLQEKGVENDTIVFFYSDNGGPGGAAKNGALKGTKWTLWEGGIRVPFIASWKGHIAPQQTNDQPVIQIDIAPTVLAAAGVTDSAGPKFDGVNILPLLEDQSTAVARDALYWRFGPQYAVRQGNWKLVKPHVDGKPLLFDLSTDIGETTDLAAKEPSRVAVLQKLWDAWETGNEQPRWGGDFWNGDGPRPKKRARDTTAPATTRPSGPWKSGDALSNVEAPDIANQPFTVTADVDTNGRDGVIVAQGGPRLGYSLFLVEGKPAFATRVGGQLTTIVAKSAAEKGKFSVRADLSPDGTLALSVDGAKVAEGKSPGLIPSQPADGFSVGSDVNSAVGEYEAPYALSGTITNVRVAKVNAKESKSPDAD